MAIEYLKYLLPTDVFNVLVWKAMLDIDMHNCRVTNVWHYISSGFAVSMSSASILINARYYNVSRPPDVSLGTNNSIKILKLMRINMGNTLRMDRSELFTEY